MTIRTEGVGIRFGGLRALSNVALTVKPGQIVGLIGPNGAGKTTLFNCITGVVQPQEGRIHFDDTEVSALRTDARIRLGLSRTFQTPRLDHESSILDAVMLGFYPTVRQSMLGAALGLPSTRREEAGLRDRALDILRQMKITDDPDAPAGTLSLGRLRLLEVARALAASPKYLLLDEPAAGMDEGERTFLEAAIRDAARRNLGVLLVEHNVGFVASLSDEIVALVQGEVISRGVPADVIKDPRVVSAYLGEQYATA